MSARGWAHSASARVGVAAALVLIALAWGEFSGRLHLGWTKVRLGEISQEIGSAYQARLETGRWSGIEGPSEASILEDGRALGPGNVAHDDIRQQGAGRFSFWGEYVYISSSDNSDPRSNGRLYEAWGPGPFSRLLRTAALGSGAVSGLFILAWVLAQANLQFGLDAMRSLLKSPKLWTALLMLVAVSVVPLGLEVGLRLITPFADTAWPSVFVPHVGFLFVPNAEVRHTNHLDYWTISRSNSLGFLDQEPKAIPGGCHVSFIGDSFVEAAQVPHEEKVQRRLEELERTKHPEWRLTTSAFGYSGTGQLNQLPFYDTFARNLSPRLVVLVFVSNDFGNNSAILEALRNGWSPDAAPRVFAQPAEGGAGLVLTSIAEDWSGKRLVGLPGPDMNTPHFKLKAGSYLYRWAFLRLAGKYRSVRELDGPSFKEQVLARARALRSNPKHAALMDGWVDAHAENIDGPFNEAQMPPVYAAAIDATRFAFAEFKRRVDADGGRLIVLATSQMSALQGGREHGLPRLRGMLKELGIPLVDQYDVIKQRGGDPGAGQFKHDGHWSAQGHRWAAEAISEHLEKDPSICAPR